MVSRKKCSKCGRVQAQGQYCLDCGSKLVVEQESAVMRPIRSSRSADQLKRDIRKWLGRIGVAQPDLQIETGAGEARVRYVLGDSRYEFVSMNQRSITDNLAAVEQFLHGRVLGIERGIETVEKAFEGYQMLEHTEFLYFREDDSADALKAKRRDWSKKLHPDIGGRSEDFERMTNEYNELISRREA